MTTSTPATHEELLNTAEVARLFRVDPKTVTKWADAGKLAVIRTPGGHRRFYANEVHDLLKPETPAGDAQ